MAEVYCRFVVYRNLYDINSVGEIKVKKQYLEVGEIVATHGIHGEVRVKVWGDSPEFLTLFDRLYFKNPDSHIDVLKSRVQKNVVIAQFDGYNTVEESASLRGKILFIDRDDVKLPEGRYFVQDLLGFSVIDMRYDKEIGKLKSISNSGAGDIYHVEIGSKKEVLIPAVEEFVKKTDIEEQKIYIMPIRGLIEDED